MKHRYRMALCVIVLVFSIAGSFPYFRPVLAQDGTTCPGALPSRLVPGEGGRVTPGAPNNLRNQPSTGSQKIGEIQPGTEFEVLDGPVCADGYAWWHIQYPWEKEGWTVESAGGQYALEPYPTLITLDGNEITYENLTFSFDPALGSGVKVKVYEPFLPSAQTPDFAVRPNDTRITLRDYPVMHRGDVSGDEPVIWVFPADDYARISDQAANLIGAMRELIPISAHLPPTALTSAITTVESPLVPALPLRNANMIFQSHRQPLQFQNGTGFRFITIYGQNIVALKDDQQFIYSFQGLSANGQYWVSVEFPIQFSLPTDFPPESDFDWENPEIYYEKALELLQAMPASDFTPDLELLDALVASMFVTGGGDRVEPAAAEPTTSSEPAAAQPANTGLIAFVSTRDGNSEIYIMNADGADQQRLTTNDRDDDYPVWSPDGQWITFSQEPQYGGGTMFIMGVDGSGLQPLPYDECATGIGWSPDGSQVAYASNGCGMGMSRLQIVNANGSTVQTAALNEPNIQHAPLDPAWSPDGTHLAFTSFSDGGIYTINPDGSNLTPVVTISDAAFTSMFLTQPVWSPDGSQLAFTSGPDIYLINSDGSDLRLFPHSTRQENTLTSQVAWSPDGSRLAFASDRDGNWEIYTANLDGSDLQRLTNSPADDYSPAWQPEAQPGLTIQLPAAAPTLFIGGQAQVQVLDDGLKLRSDAHTNAAIIEKMPNGTLVTILDGPRSGENYTWWNVRTPSGNEGWAVESADDLQTLVPVASISTQPSAEPAAVETINCTVSAAGANIRSGPGTNYNSVGTLSSDQAVIGQITSADGFVWWQLTSGGWVRSDVVNERGECERLPVVSPPSSTNSAPSEGQLSLPQTYTTADGRFAFDYPAGWFVAEGDGSLVTLSNNPVAAAALMSSSDSWSFSSGDIGVWLGMDNATPGLTKRDVAKQLVEVLGNTVDVLETISVGDYPGVVAFGSTGTADVLSIVFDLPGDRIFIVAAVTLAGEMDPYMSTIGSIALSVRATP